MLCALFTVFAALLEVAATAPTPSATPGGRIQTVFQFPNDSFVENLAVRSNGQILVTFLMSTKLVMVDPDQPGHSTLVYNFTEAHALGGITEYEPDVFAVLAGEYFSKRQTSAKELGRFGTLTYAPQPKVSKIGQIPEAQLLNGLSMLSEKDKTVVAGDTLGGVIYRIDTQTGDYQVVINSTYLSKLNTRHGVNGVHVVGDTLYFANSGQDTLVDVPIHENGTIAGPFTIISNATKPHDEYDDFTLDCEGNIFVATEGGNTIEKISPDGKRQVVIAGSLNSTAIAEPTSAAFGRGLFDKNVLYVTTAGGSAIPVNGDIIIPGKLLAVKTDSRGYC